MPPLSFKVGSCLVLIDNLVQVKKKGGKTVKRSRILVAIMVVVLLIASLACISCTGLQGSQGEWGPAGPAGPQLINI